MLMQLQIENVAVIEKANIDFSVGLNILTGETGAGKSIIIDSINAVTGEKTSKDIIRTGAQKAKITAVFSDIGEVAENVIIELMGEMSDDGFVMLSREISQDGRSVCRLNGSVVPMSIIKQISPFLINIHGQQDNQQLFSPSKHLQFVDAYGQLEQEAEEYKEVYKQLCDVRSQLQNAETNDELKERKLELLNFQIEEIETAQLVSGEEEELLSARDIMRNSENLSDSVAAVHGMLSGDEQSGGALNIARDVAIELASIVDYDESFSDVYTRAQAVVYELEEIYSEICSADGKFEFNPTKLDEIEERLDVIFRLKQKYGGSVDAVLEKLGQLKDEVDKINFSEQHILNLTKQLDELTKIASEKAKTLSIKRKTAGEYLSQQIKNELSFLDMPNVVFTVSQKSVDLKLDGCDDIEFLISANAGETPRPLVKIASGGELSRIMLAIKTSLSNADSTGALIFDEIDTGVSGKTARKIGEKMRQISAKKQVLCVTHLAQIASLANNHLLIKKEILDNRTYTSVKSLDLPERIREVARIMGGENITEMTLKAAQELIK